MRIAQSAPPAGGRVPGGAGGRAGREEGAVEERVAAGRGAAGAEARRAGGRERVQQQPNRLGVPRRRHLALVRQHLPAGCLGQEEEEEEGEGEGEGEGGERSHWWWWGGEREERGER